MTRNQYLAAAELARYAMTFLEQKYSCQWDPELREYWYQQGVQAGLTVYEGCTLEQIEYGIRHYDQRGKLECGSYEQGIADGVRQMLASQLDEAA